MLGYKDRGRRKWWLLSPADSYGVEERKEGRHIETDPGKEKHNLLSAVTGTWEGTIDHREKAATLSWGR